MNATWPVIAATPLPPAPPVPPDELERRLVAAKAAMADARVDVIVLTDKKNIDYFTDYQTLSWAYKARPVFAAISLKDITVFGSLTELQSVDLRPRHFQFVPYDGYLQEAVEAISDWALKSLTGSTANIAIDFGQDMFGRGALELVNALSNLSRDGKVTSAAEIIWGVRKIKSRFEAELKRIAFEIVNSAFDATIAAARIGMTEYELCQRMQAQIFLNGAESADPIAMLFSKGDFAYGRPASERCLEEGHYIWTDFRATYGGYPADRNRIARAGEPKQWETDTYSAVRSLTIALAESVKPGRTCAELYRSFERMWSDAALGPIYSKVSRIGHGGGLDVTEPPSISRADSTEIRRGMILHLEPKLERDGAVFQFEEVVFVTDTGSEFLSALSPQVLPLVG